MCNESRETHIRAARTDDLPRILELIQPYVNQRVLLPQTFDELDDLLHNSFVAESSEGLIGFAALEVYSRKLAELRSLAVAEKAHGTGLGRQLVSACVARAQELEITEVMAISSSEDFFRSCGFDFSLPGERKAFFFRTDL